MLLRSSYTRREFLELAAAAAAVGAGALVTACVKTVDTGPTQNIDDITVTARPGAPSGTATVGFSALGLDAGPRDGFLYVPPSYTPATPMALLILLHGAAVSSEQWKAHQSLFDEVGLLVIATDSRASTWDLPDTGLYGPDVAFLDAALAKAFTLVNVDANHVAIGGFSDGASEALGIGIANGDLFSTVIALSPGQLFGPFRRGEPSIFVSHGTEDPVFPFSRTSNQIVPTLRLVFPDVTFVEFAGGHEMPTDIVSQAYNLVKSA